MNLIVKARSLLIDPSKCPICGEPNLCAMEIAKATANPQEPCWCVSVDFSVDVLSKVSAEAQNKACICAKCAAISTHQQLNSLN